MSPPMDSWLIIGVFALTHIGKMNWKTRGALVLFRIDFKVTKLGFGTYKHYLEKILNCTYEKLNILSPS